MRNGALWLTLSLSLAARAQVPGFVVPQVANAPTGALKVALDGVDAGRIKGHVAFLADPKQEGRGLGTEGLKRVEQYLLREMKAAGLQPVPGQKSLVQAVPLRRISHLGGNLTLPGHAPLRDGLDCVLPYRAPEVFVGELVDVGLGIQEPTLGHDDYRGLDLRGKIAVLHSGVPAGAQWRPLRRPGGPAGKAGGQGRGRHRTGYGSTGSPGDHFSSGSGGHHLGGAALGEGQIPATLRKGDDGQAGDHGAGRGHHPLQPHRLHSGDGPGAEP